MSTFNPTYKFTSAGPSHYDTYLAATTGTFSVITNGTPDIHKLSDYGATSYRFALIQVLTANADLIVEFGVSGGVANPNSGSMRVGRTYEMPMIQLPRDEGSEIRILADPLGGISPVEYTIIFID